MQFIKGIAVAVAAMTAAPAMATTFTVTPESSSGAFGNPKWRQAATVTLNGSSIRTTAGMFRFTLDDGAGNKFDLETFCIELEQTLKLPATYTAQAFNPAQVNTVNALWANAFSLVNDKESAAAFQFSLWELTHDTGMDLSGGNLAIDGKDATETLAQSWLNNIDTGAWAVDPNVRIRALVSPNSQDQLWADYDTTASAVPVPQSMALMAGGAGIMGLMAIRRRKLQA